MTYEQFITKYRLSLDLQQAAAVQAADGPVLLLAVPGSGKTTVLVARLGFMLCCRGIRPEEVLTMTYTVSATEDMRSRFASFFGDEQARQLEFRTINGVCAKIIRYYEQSMNRKAFDLVTDESRLSSIIGEIYRRKTNSYAAESDISSIRTAIVYAKNMMLGDEEIGKLKVEGLDFAPIYREYCGVLKDRGLMDYDDQMVYAYRILRDFPDILSFFRQKYRYILVDEAQDTSKIQHMIIRLLSRENGSLFMVGDEDQSIYGFRAAYPEALTEFEKVHTGAKVLLMEQNYRSMGKIVTAADRFISRNQNRHPKHMTAVREAGRPITEISVFDREEQYSYLVKSAKDCKNETAILYRDNDCALPVIDLLDREGIAYRCRQIDSGFFSHRVVRDITDIIRFALDMADGETFMRIYYKLGAGISKADAEQAAEQSRNKRRSVIELLLRKAGLPPRTQKQCRALQIHFAGMHRERADKAIRRIMAMGYGNYLKERGADENKVRILEALGAREPSPERLLERLSELNDIVKAGSTAEDCKFILSTIHSSKGLEYDKVILMDVADGILPKTVILNGAKASPEELRAYEEERRLFYVGMTRAKSELAIFRFRSSEISSEFSQAIFAPESSTRTKAVPSEPAFKTQGILEEIALLAKEYVPGIPVIHKKFGAGKIIAKKDDIVAVRFDNGSFKQFSLTFALMNGQFQHARSEDRL